MKKGFVKTENLKRLREAEAIVAQRGAREQGLVLVRGAFGIGKSELTERWATDNGYIFVRARETWTKKSMLSNIATTMGLSPDGSQSAVEDRIIGRLAVSMTPLIIDEADFLIPTSRVARGGQAIAPMLETVRDITDLTGVTCFLVGMANFPALVARYEHIASRVARIVELEPLSLADVQAAVAAKSDVPMSPAVVETILQQAQGKMRLVLGAIANIEQWAAANGWKKVEAEHIKGRALVTEFTGEVKRKGAAR